MYYYLFYKFYKIAKTLKSTSLTEMKAGVVVMALETWFLFSLFNYYDLLKGQDSRREFFSFQILLPCLVILTIKWVAFVRDDTWKAYFKEFDLWSKEKNRRGTWIVLLIVALLFANLVFSGYLRSPSKFRW
ncbi:hypothetical protein SAMN05421820_107172 [Pedobacter steynii]|uniref:Uncharacterized protein n=2 Tax=Pedobacter steynii TaxID=430522 RepID=A0A1H0AS15_9SPHI|nr:hypothetical protein SAMN05421820_107172 [Pedobacter steynii]